MGGLNGFDQLEVISHEEEPPNPWGGYQRCLSGIPDCTHLLVIQDDTVVCRNFAAACHEVADAQPDAPICLFLGNMQMDTRQFALRQASHGKPFVELCLSDFMPVVATMWPVGRAEAFLEWAQAQKPRRIPDRSDDAVAGRWMRKKQMRVLATIPSLVEHPDDVHSFVRDVYGMRHALFFIGERDPLDIDWRQEYAIPRRPPRALRSRAAGKRP